MICLVCGSLMWLCVGLFVSLALISACAPTAKNAEARKAEAVGVDSDNSDEPGFYQNKKLGVSLRWDSNTFTKRGKLRPGDLLSVSYVQDTPSIALSVSTKDENSVSIEESAKPMKKAYQALFPKAKRFKI